MGKMPIKFEKVNSIMTWSAGHPDSGQAPGTWSQLGEAITPAPWLCAQRLHKNSCNALCVQLQQEVHGQS